MEFSQSIFGPFATRFQITRQDLERYLGEALSQGGDYADLYFEYLLTSSISIDESMVKSAAQGVSMGVGVRVISGERTGYAYSDDLSPEKIRKAARVAAHIAAGPSKVEKFDLNEGTPAQPLPGPDGADRDRLRRARGAGQARRPRRARLRPAHLPGAGGLCRQSAARDGGDQRGRPHARPPAAGAPERLGAGAAERRRPAARPRRRRRTRGARLLPEGKDARALRHRSRARSHRHARRRGGAGRRDDRGARARAGPGILLHEAVGHGLEADFNRKGVSAFSGRIGPEGGERTLHRGRRRHHRQPPRIAQRGRRRPCPPSATC